MNSCKMIGMISDPLVWWLPVILLLTWHWHSYSEVTAGG